jgi:hypothetical protein
VPQEGVLLLDKSGNPIVAHNYDMFSEDVLHPLAVETLRLRGMLMDYSLRPDWPGPQRPEPEPAPNRPAKNLVQSDLGRWLGWSSR